MMSGPAFFFCWLLGVVVCLALIWLAVRMQTRLARFLEHPGRR